MKAIFVVGLLILIAFLGSRFFLKKKKTFLPLRYFFFSGLVYIFLGLILGAKGLNVLSSEVLDGLNPLISLGLGWIGFLFGFQLEIKYIKKFPQKYIGLSLLQSLFLIILVSLSLFVLLRFLFPSQPAFLLYGMAVALGLFISLNSPALLNYASPLLPVKGDYYHLARFLVSVNGFWGVSGMAVVSSFWHFPFFESNIIQKGLIVFIACLIFPIFIGYMFHFLTLRKTSGQDLLVYLLGLVFFTSGVASYFNLPALFVCMVLGITYSNLTRVQEKIYPLLLSTEKPFYIIFLILIGALWDFSFDPQIGILVGFLLALKIIGNTLPLRLFEKILGFSFRLPSLFGFCFLSSGGIAIAFIVSWKLIYRLPLTDIFVSVALITTVVSELLSPWILKGAMLRMSPEK